MLEAAMEALVEYAGGSNSSTHQLLSTTIEALSRMIYGSRVDVWTFRPFRSGTWRHVLATMKTKIDVDDSHAHACGWRIGAVSTWSTLQLSDLTENDSVCWDETKMISGYAKARCEVTQYEKASLRTDKSSCYMLQSSALQC